MDFIASLLSPAGQQKSGQEGMQPASGLIDTSNMGLNGAGAASSQRQQGGMDLGTLMSLVQQSEQNKQQQKSAMQQYQTTPQEDQQGVDFTKLFMS